MLDKPRVSVSSENFSDNFIFAKNVKYSRLEHEIPTSDSINDRVIAPIREGFIITKLRTRDPRENFRTYSFSPLAGVNEKMLNLMR